MTNSRETIPSALGVGEKLKQFRKERGLSTRALAERAQLSPNTISLIENNCASPTVATLYTLANVLDVHLPAFFTGEEKNEEVNLIHDQDREKKVMAGLSVSVLPNHVLDRRVHILHFQVESGRGSGTDLMAHPGDELVICTQGELEYRVGDSLYLLKEQDSVAFKGELPHSFFNHSQEDCHFFVLITAEADQSYRFHVQTVP